MATETAAIRKARDYDLLLPRLGRADAGLVFEAGNFVRLSGTVPAQLSAVRLSGSPLGAHATAKGGIPLLLCGVALRANGKSEPDVKASGEASKTSLSVTCRFCQARLVAAGVLDPKTEGVSPYAADYGTRDVAAELAAIEARATKASKASKTSTAKKANTASRTRKSTTSKASTATA